METRCSMPGRVRRDTFIRRCGTRGLKLHCQDQQAKRLCGADKFRPSLCSYYAQLCSLWNSRRDTAHGTSCSSRSGLVRFRTAAWISPPQGALARLRDQALAYNSGRLGRVLGIIRGHARPKCALSACIRPFPLVFEGIDRFKQILALHRAELEHQPDIEDAGSLLRQRGVERALGSLNGERG